MPKYKTQTNDLTEVIEAGGGGSKLYMHTITWDLPSKFDSTQISRLAIQIICSSPVELTLSQYKSMGSGVKIPVIINPKSTTTNITKIITNISMYWSETSFIAYYNYYETNSPTSILYDYSILDIIYNVNVSPLS